MSALTTTVVVAVIGAACLALIAWRVMIGLRRRRAVSEAAELEQLRARVRERLPEINRRQQPAEATSTVVEPIRMEIGPPPAARSVPPSPSPSARNGIERRDDVHPRPAASRPLPRPTPIVPPPPDRGSAESRVPELPPPLAPEPPPLAPEPPSLAPEPPSPERRAAELPGPAPVDRSRIPGPVDDAGAEHLEEVAQDLVRMLRGLVDIIDQPPPAPKPSPPQSSAAEHARDDEGPGYDGEPPSQNEPGA